MLRSTVGHVITFATRSFNPSSWELYNITLVEGLLALNEDKVDEAVRCLDLSISACLEYERARAQCCVRAPNLELAGKLLEHGERPAVSRHLAACRDVWDSLQFQIDRWIRAIDDGGTPEFRSAGDLRVPRGPAHTLRMQWMNACTLAIGPVSADMRAVPRNLEQRELHGGSMDCG